MPNEENLIPLTQRPPEEAAAIRLRGSKAKTQGKKDAQKWRQIKARVVKDISDPKDRAWMMEKIQNRDSCASEILLWVEKMKNQITDSLLPLDLEDMARVGNLMTQAAKFTHGDKVKIVSKTIHINIEVNSDEIKEHMNKILGYEEE